jgi:ABC-type transport system substrate-binding protein
VDDWIDAIAGTADVDALRELYCNIVQQINADVPVVFLYERAWVAGYRQALQNLQLSPGPASIALGSENWWIRP